MFNFPIPSFDTFSQTNPKQVSHLLKFQNLFLPNGFDLSTSIPELLTAYHNDFRLTSSQARFLVQLITNLEDPSVDVEPNIQQSSGNRFELLVLDRAAQLSSHPKPTYSTKNQSLTNFKLIADLLQIQIKLYTVFCGILSCRKVGVKRQHKVRIFATLDNQYAIIQKTPGKPIDSTPGRVPSSASKIGVQVGKNEHVGNTDVSSVEISEYLNDRISIHSRVNTCAEQKRISCLDGKRFEESLRKAIHGTSLVGYEQLWSKGQHVGHSQSVAEEYTTC